MRILVTGAKGFIGRNLVAQLRNIAEGKARCYGDLSIEDIFEYDVDSNDESLEQYCAQCDFVFNLAGVNRPENQDEFFKVNSGFIDRLTQMLIKADNRCPIMISSSVQATLSGRFGDTPYGRSKKSAEEKLIEYAQTTGAKVLIYRFPNVFGKWARPNYNSVVATFCHNIANGLPIRVDNPTTELELLYIDDLVDQMIQALKGYEMRVDEHYCSVPTTHRATLGQIVELLTQFKDQPQTLIIPTMEDGSFSKKLYSTYLSYVQPKDAIFALKMNCDHRGSFTEMFKSQQCGQVSVNISKPGITKGEHWHNSKWEMFAVVSGEGLIRMRKIDSEEITEFEVSGDKIEVVQMLPGYTHNIINLSKDKDLVTVMWCNECFDPEKPDTYFEPVER